MWQLLGRWPRVSGIAPLMSERRALSGWVRGPVSGCKLLYLVLGVARPSHSIFCRRGLGDSCARGYALSDCLAAVLPPRLVNVSVIVCFGSLHASCLSVALTNQSQPTHDELHRSFQFGGHDHHSSRRRPHRVQNCRRASGAGRARA